MSALSPRSLHLLAALTLPTLASAYSWQFQSTPQQCQNLSISITGSGGQAPYSLLVIPYGASPLPNNVEARHIFERNFTDSSASFQLPYPTDSQFVAVMSDATGFGSGGTSVAATVQTSSDSSCFDPSKNVAPDYTFSVYPENQIVQCQETRLFWQSGQVQGTPAFAGVIPGGDSFAVPNSTISDKSSDGQGLGFSWTPSVRSGTQLLIVSGDDRGPGSGGSVMFTVAWGTNNDVSCLNNDSPSSTPGSPAGGSYPTSTDGAGVGGGGNSGSGGSNNVGAIVGGVVGGVAGVAILLLLGLFLLRRRAFHKSAKDRPVDLLNEEGDNPPPVDEALPEYYRPEPFVVPEPTEPTFTEATSTSDGESRPGFGHRRASTATTNLTDFRAPMSVAGSSARTGKSGMPPTLRPVNIVQHEDAGPPPEDEPRPSQDQETIELPPAYTNIRR